jgi:hypothetical protein
LFSQISEYKNSGQVTLKGDDDDDDDDDEKPN